MRKSARRVFALVACGVLLAIFGLFWSMQQTHRGYFAPAFGPEGRYLYFIERQASGFAWGIGWEHFTPPASAFVLSDDFSLLRLHWESGAVEILESWQESPVKGRIIKEYRGRIFNTVSVRIRATEAGQAEYRIRMSIPVVPRSEIHRLVGNWQADGQGERGTWEPGSVEQGGYDITPLNGPWEVMTLPGDESFPAAIVAVHSDDGSFKILRRNDEYEDLYPNGPPAALITERSRRGAIERLNTIRRTRGELLARFMAEGLREGEALLKVGKEMRRLGYYPKSTTMTARPLADAGSVSGGDAPPLFEIAEAEMKSGIFPDIEQAIDRPGKAIDKTIGNYVIHRDYETSAALNALLKRGATEFRLRYRGTTYEITIKRP